VTARAKPGHWRGDSTTRHGIPVTTPIQTIIDLALRLGRRDFERMINEADKYDLVHPPELREALDLRQGKPGVARLRHVLDQRTFRLTKEELERRFLPLARRAGLSVPLTGQWVNNFEVDFYWPDLGLIVETTSCATTARRPSRRGTGSAIRPTPPPASPSSASPTSRSATNRTA
jgi:hypothetical protein